MSDLESLLDPEESELEPESESLLDVSEPLEESSGSSGVCSGW